MKKRSSPTLEDRSYLTSGLKIGDLIRIVSLPCPQVEGYRLHPDTRRTYRALITRGRSVRIAFFRGSLPWFRFRLRRRDRRWEYHSMAVGPEDANWVRVVPRKSQKAKQK